MGIQRVKRPITHAGKRFLTKREPRLLENPKQTIFLRGKNSSEIASGALKDLYHLKKPNCVMLSKKNDVLPFNDLTPIEAFSKKYDASMFVFASHTKKRPHNIVLGRMFDGQLLDMIELGIDKIKRLSEFPGDKIPVGTKPCILFAGPQFSSDADNTRLQNLLVDMLNCERVDCIRLHGLEHVIIFTLHDEKLLMRSYKILLKKSGTKLPRIELEEIGPSIDFSLRRKKLASEDLFKLSCKTPKELKAKKVKNVRRDVFGTMHGRIHIKQQNISQLTTRKMKGLKQPKRNKKNNKK